MHKAAGPTAFPALALLLALALAGCSGGGDAGDPQDGTPTGDASGSPEPSAQEFSFSLGAAAGLPVGGGIIPVDDGRRVPFEVPDGYTHLEATATWECDVEATCELDLELRHGEQDLITANGGPSPVTLDVDDPPAGRWTFWAFPSGQGSLVVGMAGTLTVTLS